MEYIYATQCCEIVQNSFLRKGNIRGEKNLDDYVKDCTKDWLRKAFDWPKTQHDDSALPGPLDGRLARAIGARLDWALDARLMLAATCRSCEAFHRLGDRSHLRNLGTL